MYGDDDAYKLFNIHASDEFQTHKQNSLENCLISLLQSGNETLRLSSAKLLFDLYQVYYRFIMNDTIVILIILCMLIQHLFQGECHLFKHSELAYIVVHPQEMHNWNIYVVHLNYATFRDKDKILLKLLQGEGIKVIEGLSVFNYNIINIYIYIYIP